MFKVLIWDYAGVAAQWLEQVADNTTFEVVDTITPAQPVPKILLELDAWDRLLIFEQGARNFFDATIQTLHLPPEKVIYALDINSWLQHPKDGLVLTNPATGGSAIYLHVNYEIGRQLNKFATCTVDGLSYVATSTDDYVIRPMHVMRKNHAADEMNRFHALTRKYYDVDDSDGYFLDLGANIGTTGIYFTTKIAPNLKLLAFEPDAENFKLLRINTIINDIEARVTLVNCGLGDKFDTLTMYRDLHNPGHNNVTEPIDGLPTETVKVMPLDAYLAEQKIAAQSVKYIWIDTEGFEPQVILGAKNLLRENPVPVFMECNLRIWDKSGALESMLTLLSERYSHFVHVQGGDEVHPLDDLRTIERPNNTLGQIGDIFLIRRGALD